MKALLFKGFQGECKHDLRVYTAPGEQCSWPGPSKWVYAFNIQGHSLPS